MRRKILAALSLCAPLLLSACAGQQDNTNQTASATPAASRPFIPDSQIVTASAEEAQLAAGGEGEAVVRLKIAEGYHVNANPPSDKFYIGTELQAKAQEGVTPGQPVYPPALTKKFQFSQTPLAVYEGEAVIRLPLRAEQSARKGQRTLYTQVRVQPCDDQACLQPRNVEANIPVTIN